MTTDSFRVVWSPESEDDVLSIWRWGAARFSPAIADGHLRDIHRAAMRLAASPLMRRERDDLRAGIRQIVVYPTVLFCRVTHDRIEVVRVVDGQPLLREAGKVSPKATDGVCKAGRLDRKFAVTFVQAVRRRSSGPHPIRRHGPSKDGRLSTPYGATFPSKLGKGSTRRSEMCEHCRPQGERGELAGRMDHPATVSRIQLAQLPPHDLAGRGLRQVGDELDRARRLVGGELQVA